MALLVTHTTAADGTFSSAGASAWNATHAIAGTLDLATETTGPLDLVTRTTGSLDLTARSTGTIELLTQTRGATANQLMYGGASGQVAQSSGMVWDAANTRLTVANKIGVGNIEMYSDGLRKIANPASNLSITGGSIVAPDTGSGGNINLAAGDARITGFGGAIEFTGGRGAGTLSGGNVQATGGSSSTSGTDSNGGSVTFVGGDSSRSNGYGGDVQLIAGSSNAASGGYGGTAQLMAGSVSNTTGVPGNVSLVVGENSAGVVGSFNFSAYLATPVAVAAGTGTTHAADLPVTVDGVQYYIRLYS